MNKVDIDRTWKKEGNMYVITMVKKTTMSKKEVKNQIYGINEAFERIAKEEAAIANQLKNIDAEKEKLNRFKKEYQEMLA